MGFDIDKMSFERVKGRENVDIVMMQAIGIIQSTINGFRLTPLPNEPQHQQEVPQVTQEEVEEEIDDVVTRMENIELQIGVLDANMDELT